MVGNEFPRKGINKDQFSFPFYLIYLNGWSPTGESRSLQIPFYWPGCPTGNLYRVLGNAIAERVNGILKDEYDLHTTFTDYLQANEAVKSAVNKYNNQRPHASCDYLVPSDAHNSNGVMKKCWYPKNWGKASDQAFDDAKITWQQPPAARTSPSGFKENLHPSGSIFSKILAADLLSDFLVHIKIMVRKSSFYKQTCWKNQELKAESKINQE